MFECDRANQLCKAKSQKISFLPNPELNPDTFQTLQTLGDFLSLY